MRRICSNTDISKPVFFYIRIINSAFIKFISACFFPYFTLTLICKRAHIATEQFDEDFLV